MKRGRDTVMRKIKSILCVVLCFVFLLLSACTAADPAQTEPQPTAPATEEKTAENTAETEAATEAPTEKETEEQIMEWEGYHVKKLTVAGKDISGFRLVFQENDDTVRNCAKDLVNYIDGATGIKLSRGSEKQADEICVGVTDRDTEKVKAEREKLYNDGYGIIFVTETVYRSCEEAAKKYLNDPYPIIIPVPDECSDGTYSKERIAANIKKAIGSDLI